MILDLDNYDLLHQASNLVRIGGADFDKAMDELKAVRGGKAPYEEACETGLLVASFQIADAGGKLDEASLQKFSQGLPVHADLKYLNKILGGINSKDMSFVTDFEKLALHLVVLLSWLETQNLKGTNVLRRALGNDMHVLPSQLEKQ